MPGHLKNPDAAKSAPTCFGKRQQGRWLLAIVPLLILLGWLLWRPSASGQIGEWRANGPNAGKSASVFGSGRKVGMSGSNSPLGAGMPKGPDPEELALNDPDPRAQHAQWEKRLARAQEVYDNYQRTTRYPFESRPADEHADQMYPNREIVETRRLHRQGELTAAKVTLQTSQERIYVAGNETVLFTVAAFDESNNPLPLNVKFATVGDPPLDNKPSTQKPVFAAFNDQGVQGDTTAADGAWTFQFSPATQGFRNFTGQLRLDMRIEVQSPEGIQDGTLYFDMYYTPNPPAVWTGQVREALENGSLNLYLKVNVSQPGLYVATGRFDDASGKPLVLAVHNGELTTGLQEIRFRAFGKLLRDSKAPQPLKLRDVDGFLLLEDASTDRAFMPRLPGAVHQTKTYAVEQFSDAEWQSEQRERYLREYLNDIDLAKAKLKELDALMSPRKSG